MCIIRVAAGHTKACEDGHLSHSAVASAADSGGELVQRDAVYTDKLS